MKKIKIEILIFSFIMKNIKEKLNLNKIHFIEREIKEITLKKH